MGKNKLKKIAETKEMANILEFPRELKGKWNTHFKNDNPIVLELACGKGHYTLAMGRMFPNKNFIGIDIKGTRLWTGGKTAYEEGLSNVCFTRMVIEQIDEFFAPGEVDEIWITFPDPQPKNERRRLTHPLFLEKYKTALKPNGWVHLKTDNTMLFEFTIGVLAGMNVKPEKVTRNLYLSDLYQDPILQIKTYYESLWNEQGSNIKYTKFRL
ncbi:MAG: tRNA (guanosine(46)-N7)-methyltransferase TrmB [Bacteroidetes bacterium]|nr:tRNA (guanosine(46)-N7)-methyltransferase TrmB [Bacteroidota bacterium]